MLIWLYSWHMIHLESILLITDPPLFVFGSSFPTARYTLTGLIVGWFTSHHKTKCLLMKERWWYWTAMILYSVFFDHIYIHIHREKVGMSLQVWEANGMRWSCSYIWGIHGESPGKLCQIQFFLFQILFWNRSKFESMQTIVLNYSSI